MLANLGTATPGSGNGQTVSFVPVGSPGLNASTAYFIVLTSSVPGQGWNESPTVTYAGMPGGSVNQGLSRSFDAGATWQPILTDEVFVFTVNGTANAVPEPASAVFELGSGAYDFRAPFNPQ